MGKVVSASGHGGEGLKQPPALVTPIWRPFRSSSGKWVPSICSANGHGPLALLLQAVLVVTGLDVQGGSTQSGAAVAPPGAEHNGAMGSKRPHAMWRLPLWLQRLMQPVEPRVSKSLTTRHDLHPAKLYQRRAMTVSPAQDQPAQMYS